MIIFCLLCLSPCAASEARAETRVTITVAAGGAACGLFFFLHYAFRVSMSIEQHESATTAIFNFGPEGWQMQFPIVNITGSGRRILTFPGHLPETIQMDVLKWRF